MERKIKIALADDHAMLRKSLKIVINSMPEFDVIIEEENGQLLLEKLQQTTSLPDICIIDINMPKLNGYETCAAIKKSFPAINVLALSMYDKEQSIISMLRSGASGYLLKDAEPTELKKALLEIFETGFYNSSSIRKQVAKSLSQENELTETEIQFLKLCCTEMTYKDIAAKMFKSPRTIDGYREHLFSKLGVTTRSGLVMFAIKMGWIAINNKEEL